MPETALIVEITRLLLSSAFVLMELGKLSDAEKLELLAKTRDEVASRNPADLPGV